MLPYPGKMKLLSIVVLIHLLLASSVAAESPQSDYSDETAEGDLEKVEATLAGGGDDDGDDDDSYILHEVTRLKFAEIEDIELESENGDDDEEENPEYEQAPYKRYKKWKMGWPKHPLYVMIIGG